MLRENKTIDQWGSWAVSVISTCVLVTILTAIGQGQAPSSGTSKVSSNSAFEHDLSAARQGDTLAQLRVGKAYYFGTNDANGKGNHSEAFKWFELASRGGCKEGAAWLGNSYLNGDGVREDKARGTTLIRSAADADDPVGLRFLALMYQDGNGIRRDYSQAFALLSKAVLLNDPNSYDRLGNLYRNGFGTQKDPRKAVKLYAEGARLGDPWAQLQLGEMYYTGAPEADVPKDQAMALRLYEDAASQGNKLAAFYAGKMYAAGTGAKQDYQKAVEYYLEAARRRFPAAQLSMGEAAEHGLGTAVNLFDAYAWYSLAADNGNTKANERLETLSATFTATEKSEAEARFRELKQNIEQD
jgi:TPR repeat protein